MLLRAKARHLTRLSYSSMWFSAAQSCHIVRLLVLLKLMTHWVCVEQVQMVKDIQQASRRLNKRQMTWFRDDPMYLWLDAKKPVAELVDQIARSLAEPVHIGNGCIDQSCVSKCSLQLHVEQLPALQEMLRVAAVQKLSTHLGSISICDVM